MILRSKYFNRPVRANGEDPDQKKFSFKYSKEAHISPAMAIRGILNHNFVNANFPKYCMGEMGKKEKKSRHLSFLYTTYFTIVSRSEVSNDFL